MNVEVTIIDCSGSLQSNRSQTLIKVLLKSCEGGEKEREKETETLVKA